MFVVVGAPARDNEVLFADDCDHVLREVYEVLAAKLENGLVPGLEHLEHVVCLRLTLVLFSLEHERERG